MSNYSFLIKPASSLCNYCCTYCFYDDVSEHREVKSSGIMTYETARNVVKMAVAAPEANMLTFIFQGGEPTLAGIDYFRTFIKTVEELKLPQQKISYALQTNGSKIDIEWCRFLKENDFLVGISLDGYRANHDFYRITSNGKGTYDEVMKTITLLKQQNIQFNILTVLTNALAKHPSKLYEFYREHEFDYIQLIPCLPGLDDENTTYALTPEYFASFYKEFFDLWYEDYIAEKYMSVTLFDNLIPLINGSLPQQCGMLGFCSPQFVIEADGAVYPCDFYVLDQLKIGNVNFNSFQELAKNSILSTFLMDPKRMSVFCEKCPFISLCNGNCKRQNITYFNDTMCGYLEFLKYAYPKMREILEIQKQRYFMGNI